MRISAAISGVLLCGMLTTVAPDVYAQRRPVAEFIVDPQFRFPAKADSSADPRVIVEKPGALYGSKPLKKAELSVLLKDYDPEKSAVKLYGYYILRFPKVGGKVQQVRVPYYSFQGEGASYSLEGISGSGDTLNLRFGVPASQGHNYELTLGVKAAKIYGVRYVGQGGAGNFTLCRDYVGKPLGTQVSLNHVYPGGACFDLTPEYEETHFLGRGISPTNRTQLIVVDEKFRTLKSWQLRYKIRGIEAGSGFYVTFDDPKLSAESSEVKLSEVIGGKGWRR